MADEHFAVTLMSEFTNIEKKKRFCSIGLHHKTEVTTVCKVGFVKGQVGYRPKIINQGHTNYVKFFSC
jgi:hypothetical protein